MRAIILAGGFGTRLKSAIGEDIPKPMAPVAGEPFLAHYLRWLRGQEVTEAVLSVHHLGQVIRGYFGETWEGMRLHYAQEPRPLGTGGALRFALAQFPSDAPVLVANGDSFVSLAIGAMLAAHRQAEAALTVALREMPDCRRYGEAVVDDTRHITAFHYPGRPQPGWISAGVYIVSPTIFDGCGLPENFSFEADFQRPYADRIRPLAWLTHGYFIDIGVPDDYARAERELLPHMQAAS